MKLTIYVINKRLNAMIGNTNFGDVCHHLDFLMLTAYNDYAEFCIENNICYDPYRHYHPYWGVRQDFANFIGCDLNNSVHELFDIALWVVSNYDEVYWRKVNDGDLETFYKQ